MDVLLSMKQIKNVKNISFVILFTDIVHHIYSLWDFRFDSRHRDNVHMLQHSISIFLHEQFVEQGLFEESLYLQRTNLSKSAGAGCSVYTG